MSDLVDFTVEGRHTKFYDTYIVCGSSTFMVSRNTLCRIDYFDRLFDGNLEIKEKNDKPCCTLDEQYETLINNFLNYLYYSKYDGNTSGELIELCDFIGYSDLLNKILEDVKDMDALEYIYLIEQFYYIIGNNMQLDSIKYDKFFNNREDTMKEDVLEYIDSMEDTSFIKHYIINNFIKYVIKNKYNPKNIIVKFYTQLYKKEI